MAGPDRKNDGGEAPARIRLFAGAADCLSAVVLFALMAMTCVDVFGREVLSAPLDGATELTQLMLGVIVFGVMPSVCYREDHVTVDLFDRWFPQRFAHARQAVLNLAAAVMLAVVAWRVWVVGARQLDYGDATEFLRIPLGPISYFIAVMSGIGALVLLANTVRHATGHGRLDASDAQVS